MVQWQSVPINFDGMDTKTDPKQVLPGQLIRAENAVYQTLKQVRKRNGFTTISSVPKGNVIDTYQNELVALDGENLYSYDAAEYTMVNKGVKLGIDLRTSSIVKNSYQQTQLDFCSNSNVSVYVWYDSQGGCKYSVIDEVTGLKLIDSATLDASGVYPRVYSIGTYLLLFYRSTSNNLPYYRAISVTTPQSISSAVACSATALGSQCGGYEISYLGGKLYLSMFGSDGKLRARTIDSSLVLSSEVIVATINPSTTYYHISSFVDDVNNKVWVSYSALWFSGHISLFVLNYDTTLTLSLNPVLIEDLQDSTLFTMLGYRATGYVVSGNATILYECGGSPSSLANMMIRQASVSAAGTVSNVKDFCRSVGLISKVFIYNSKHYVTALHDSVEQATGFLFQIESGKVVGKLSQGEAGSLLGAYSAANVVSLSQKVFKFAYCAKSVLGSSGDGKKSTIYSTLGVNSAQFTFDFQMMSMQFAKNLHITGAITSIYDGAGVYEHGFNLYPETLLTNNHLNIGALPDNASIAYQATYEWTDNQGQIHRSSPSDDTTVKTSPITVLGFSTTSGSNQITISGYRPDAYVSYAAVSGSGVPAGCYLVYASYNGTTTTIYLSANCTATASNVAITFGGQFVRGYQSYLNSDLVTLQSAKYSIFPVAITGVNTGYAPELISAITNNSYLSPNLSFYTVTDGTFSRYNGTGYLYTSGISSIDSISGIVTFSTNFPTGITQIVLNMIKVIPATFTSGSATVTTAYADEFFIGQSVEIGFASLYTYTVTAKGVGNITISSNAAMNYPSALAGLHGTVNLKVGQTVTLNGFTGPQQIIAAFGDQIQLGTNATSSTSGNALITGTNGVTIQVPNLRVTDKSNVRIVIYRTQSNQTIFYRVSPISPPYSSDKSRDYFSTNDYVSDSVLIGNDLLYTTSGEVENISFPATFALALYKNRLIALPCENRTSWWFSKEVWPGYPCEASDLFVKNIDQRGGELQAVGFMDDKLIFGKNDLIFLVVGDGPNKSGSNDDFSEAQLVTTDAGMSNRRSVTATPKGIIFQSKKGIYLLDRALVAEYIGMPVEGYNDQTVLCVELVSTLNHIRISMSGGDILNYDYLLNKWSIFPGLSFVDSTIYNNQYAAINTTGVLKKEDTGVYLDDGAYYKLKLVSSWFAFATLQGFQRIRKAIILGDYKTPHNLIVSVAYDFINTISQVITIPVSGVPQNAYQWRAFFKRQKCESIQLTIEDEQSASLGEGYTFSGIAIEVGVKSSSYKLPASQSNG